MQELVDVERSIRSYASRFRQMPDHEDAIQEGMINAWKDLESGNYDYWHIVRRAQIRIKAVLLDPSHHMTGHIRTSREGIEKDQGRKTREKIRQFVDEYMELHDKKPSGVTIAKGTGITASVVHAHLRRMADGIDHNMALIKEGTNETDYAAYHVNSLDDMPVEREATPSFEDELVSNMAFQEMIASLSDFEKALLELHFKHDKNFQDIGDTLGYTKNGRIKARKHVLKAIEKVRATV